MPPAAIGLVANVTVVPAGTAVADKVIGEANVPVTALLIVVVEVVLVPQVMAVGVVADNVKSEIGAAIVKLVLEISKKTLPTASTLILAVVEVPTGIINISLPSLGVLAIKTVGNVSPPLVDKETFTFAQLTGAAVVLFTDHVIS